MTRDDARLWTDRSCLQDVQYRTDANLAARQSIYACQRPRLDLAARVLGLAALRGGETVVDVGCGNGTYLAELARRGHAGPVLGVDLSAGMLQATRGRAPGASLVAGDAAALPRRERLRLDDGEDLLATEFTAITRHDFTGELLIPGPQPVEDYARSMVITQDLPDPGAFAAAVGQLVPTGDQGVFRVRTHSGCLVCS
jgi:SAM-dependent methyltransferase